MRAPPSRSKSKYRPSQKKLLGPQVDLPDAVNMDAHRSYREGVSKTFPNVKDIAKCGVNKPHANNNRIERLNSTLREKVKVQRGWKCYETLLVEGKRIQYNFVIL